MKKTNDFFLFSFCGVSVLSSFDPQEEEEEEEEAAAAKVSTKNNNWTGNRRENQKRFFFFQSYWRRAPIKMAHRIWSLMASTFSFLGTF